LRTFIAAALTIFIFAGVVHAQDGTNDFVEVEVSNLNPYIGEPFLYSVRWYSAASSEILDTVAPIWPTFEGLGRVSETYTSTVERRNDILYSVVVIDVWLVPIRSGTLSIEPLEFRTSQFTLDEPYSVKSAAFTVLVQDLPQPIPEDFSGAVGPFTVDTRNSTETTEVGTPFYYEMELVGSGGLQQVVSPEIEFPSEWQVIQDQPEYENVSGTVNRRTFRWRIVPMQAGNYVIASFSLSYFDPETTTYVSVNTSPVQVSVGSGSEIVESQLPTSPAKQDVPSWVEYQSDYWLGGADFATSVLFWMLWLVPVILFVLVWLVVRVRELGKRTSRSGRKVGKRGLRRSIKRLDGRGQTLVEQMITLLNSSDLSLDEEPWFSFRRDLEQARYAPDDELGEILRQRFLGLVG